MVATSGKVTTTECSGTHRGVAAVVVDRDVSCIPYREGCALSLLIKPTSTIRRAATALASVWRYT